MSEYTKEEERILNTPVGELNEKEYEILKDIFIRKGMNPPIIIKQGNMCHGFGVDE
jgi:hypothetical protein